MGSHRWMKAIVMGGVLSLLGAFTFQTAPTATAAMVAGVEDESLDTLIFRNGRVVKGTIIEETPNSIKMRVVMAGGLSAETTYTKADILTIERGKKPEEAAAAAKKDEAKPATTSRDRRRTAADEAKPAPTPSASAPVIYLMTIKGEIGRNFSNTPLAETLRDVKSHQPDVLVLRMETDFSFMGMKREEYDVAAADFAFSQLETVRTLASMLTDEIRDDSSWEKKPRLVFWVRRALGGAAFLPLVSPDIYFTSDGRMGGIGYLELIFEGVGDEVAREKQYSLRLGRAEGLAVKGGHDPVLVKAMTRADTVLSVRYEGGRPILLQRFPEGPDEELLVDDGDESAGRRDTMEDYVRMRGNDVLNFNAELAFKLNVSKGTVDRMEDLVRELGLGRDYKVVEGRASQIFTSWTRSVDEAEVNFRRLWREYNDTPIQGDYNERTAARGKRIRILREIRGMLDRFREAINPRAIGGAPANWESQIHVLIEQLQLQQRLDRR